MSYEELTSGLSIRPACAALRVAALRLVLAEVQEQARDSLATELSQTAGRLHDSHAGLLASMRDGAIVGAIWAQEQPGRTGVVWPPQLVGTENESTADALVSAAETYLAACNVRVAQALVSDSAGTSANRLRRAGFAHMADLLYLVCLESAFPQAISHESLEFETYSEANHDRFAAVLEASYVGTRDCPALNGVRTADEVLDGYRASGEFDAARWMVARHAGRDAGCLLLTDHAQSGYLELIYMGLAPEARGRGLGRQLVARAQQMASSAGRRGLLAAVDAANEPAVALYADAGFHVWDRRTAFLKILPDARRRD